MDSQVDLDITNNTRNDVSQIYNSNMLNATNDQLFSEADSYASSDGSIGSNISKGQLLIDNLLSKASKKEKYLKLYDLVEIVL